MKRHHPTTLNTSSSLTIYTCVARTQKTYMCCMLLTHNKGPHYYIVQTDFITGNETTANSPVGLMQTFCPQTLLWWKAMLVWRNQHLFQTSLENHCLWLDFVHSPSNFSLLFQICFNIGRICDEFNMQFKMSIQNSKMLNLKLLIISNRKGLLN